MCFPEGWGRLGVPWSYPKDTPSTPRSRSAPGGVSNWVGDPESQRPAGNGNTNRVECGSRKVGAAVHLQGDPPVLPFIPGSAWAVPSDGRILRCPSWCGSQHQFGSVEPMAACSGLSGCSWSSHGQRRHHCLLAADAQALRSLGGEGRLLAVQVGRLAVWANPTQSADL